MLSAKGTLIGPTAVPIEDKYVVQFWNIKKSSGVEKPVVVCVEGRKRIRACME